MVSRLLRGAWFVPITAIVIGGGAATALAAPSQSSCPTVAAGTGAVSPAPAPDVDWSGCDLTSANLGSADLTGANLSNANLTTANLTKANTDQADFANANLFDANGEGATLTNTNFTGANMTFFAADDLAGSDLQDVNITNANFSGEGVDFNHVRSGGITGTTPDLPQFWTLDNGFLIGPGADFSGDDMAGFNFSNQNLSDTDLAGANLTGANLKNVNLAGADVQGTIFTGVTWPGLESGDIVGTPASLPANFSLVDAYIVGPDASLISANLAGANLSGTDLAGADFGLATLDHANLTGANLTDAFLDEASLTGVTWSNTTCPDGTNSDNDFGTCVNNIDDRPPVAKPTIEGLGGTNGWFIGPVTVVWHWTDGNATINPAKCPAKTTSTTQGAAVVISATCFNALGAEGTASETFKIDTTPPAVSVTGVLKNHVYALGRAPKPACRTADATSGVATAAKVTLAGAGVGKFTATCGGATDKAGNEAAPVSLSYTVAYGFPGFASPKPGSKLAKSAPAIIVTFRLANGRGKPVSSSVAAKLSQKHQVRVTLTGPGITAVTAACRWDSATKYFRCSIKTPSAVRTGRSYRIRAAENVGSGFVTAPVIGKATNPEVITFR